MIFLLLNIHKNREWVRTFLKQMMVTVAQAAMTMRHSRKMPWRTLSRREQPGSFQWCSWNTQGRHR